VRRRTSGNRHAWTLRSPGGAATYTVWEKSRAKTRIAAIELFSWPRSGKKSTLKFEGCLTPRDAYELYRYRCRFITKIYYYRRRRLPYYSTCPSRRRSLCLLLYIDEVPSVACAILLLYYYCHCYINRTVYYAFTTEEHCTRDGKRGNPLTSQAVVYIIYLCVIALPLTSALYIRGQTAVFT